MSATMDYPIEVMAWEPRYLVAVQDTALIANNGPWMGEQFGKLYQAIGTAGIQPTGPSCGVYWMWDEEAGKAHMAVAAQVAMETEAPEGYERIDLGEAQAAVLTYTGGFSGIGDAHMALGKYMEAEGLECKGPAIEEYVVDMNQDTDSNNWVTKIYYLY